MVFVSDSVGKEESFNYRLNVLTTDRLKVRKIKGVYSWFTESQDVACHMGSHTDTQCHLSPDTSERAPP